MINEQDDFFEDLAKSFPELMEKSRIGEHVGVGAGWHGLIETLCGSIYSHVAQARFGLKGAVDYPRNDNGVYLERCEREYKDAVENLPVITQIKEKFGTLSFYYNGGNERVDALVGFAESMSGKICEECGDKGSLDTAGWLKTHCVRHRRPDPVETRFEIQEGRVSTHIGDE